MAKSPHTQTFIVLFVVFLVLSLPNFGMAVWALYDGTVHYPELAERWQAYEQVVAEYPQAHRLHWQTVASQNGWPTDVPREYGEADIITQFVLMGFCGMIGFVFVGLAVMFGVLWRRGEEQARVNQTVSS